MIYNYISCSFSHKFLLSLRSCARGFPASCYLSIPSPLYPCSSPLRSRARGFPASRSPLPFPPTYGLVLEASPRVALQFPLTLYHLRSCARGFPASRSPLPFPLPMVMCSQLPCELPCFSLIILYVYNVYHSFFVPLRKIMSILLQIF